jgi:hypothetical protein
MAARQTASPSAMLHATLAAIGLSDAVRCGAVLRTQSQSITSERLMTWPGADHAPYHVVTKDGKRNVEYSSLPAELMRSYFGRLMIVTFHAKATLICSHCKGPKFLNRAVMLRRRVDDDGGYWHVKGRILAEWWGATPTAANPVECCRHYTPPAARTCRLDRLRAVVSRIHELVTRDAGLSRLTAADALDRSYKYVLAMDKARAAKDRIDGR